MLKFLRLSFICDGQGAVRRAILSLLQVLLTTNLDNEVSVSTCLTQTQTCINSFVMLATLS